MCYQPDVTAYLKAFDDALLELFKTWAGTAAEYVDGADIGPQDWNAEFLQQVESRMPELKEHREYGRLVRMLDDLAGTAEHSVTEQ